jgi:hypothetical protein
MSGCVSLTIHSCPPHRVRVVATMLEQRWLVDVDGADRKTLHLGYPYSIDTSTVDELVHDLRDVAPDIAFTVTDDPDDEWLGSLRRYVPALGLFEASCDHDGNVVFTVADIVKLDTLRPARRQAKLGLPWEEAIAEMPPGEVTEPQPCKVRWEPATGQLTVHAGGPGGSDLPLASGCVTAVDDDGNLADPAAADTVLAGAGFLRANEWEAQNVTCRVWATDVYRLADDLDERGAPTRV